MTKGSTGVAPTLHTTTCNATSEEVCEVPHHHIGSEQEPNEDNPNIEIPTISFSAEDDNDPHEHPARSQTPLPGASAHAGLAQRTENRTELSASPSLSQRTDGGREKLTLSGDSPEIARRDREHIIHHGTTNHHMLILSFLLFIILFCSNCFSPVDATLVRRRSESDTTATSLVIEKGSSYTLRIKNKLKKHRN